MTKSFFISRSKALRQKDPEASRHTCDPSKDHKGQGSCRSNCRQGIDAEEAAYDNRVHQIVYILKNISQQYGNREENDQPERAAFCHVILHKFSFSPQKTLQVFVLWFTYFALYLEYRIVCSL